MKLFKAMLATGFLCLSFSPVENKKMNPTLTDDFKRIVSFNSFKSNKAHATADSLFSTAKMLYYMVNGDPSDNSQSGFIGMINEIIGPTALGGGLSENNINACSDIPASGTASMTDDGGTFVMTFNTPARTIPAHFPNYASQAFEKRVDVKQNGTDFFTAEFKCEAGGVTTGYFRMNISWSDEDVDGDSTNDTRQVETYFQFSNITNKKNIDMYMTLAASTNASYNEKMGLKFYTADGDEFTIFGARYYGGGAGSASNDGIAIHGKKSQDLFYAKLMGSGQTAVTPDSWSQEVACVDVTSGSGVDHGGGLTHCTGTHSLSIGTGNTIFSGASFTQANIAGMTLTAVPTN